MLNKMPLKLASLALGLALIAGCQNQGAGQVSGAPTAKTPAAAAAPSSQEQSTQATQATQNILTIHIAQKQAAPNLLVLDLGENKKLYAVPEPVMTQADMVRAAPAKTQDGKTYLVFNMSEEGSKKLADISTRSIGHYLLLSVKGQLVSITEIDQPATAGNLVMATKNEEHSLEILKMLE